MFLVKLKVLDKTLSNYLRLKEPKNSVVLHWSYDSHIQKINLIQFSLVCKFRLFNKLK